MEPRRDPSPLSRVTGSGPGPYHHVPDGRGVGRRGRAAVVAAGPARAPRAGRVRHRARADEGRRRLAHPEPRGLGVHGQRVERARRRVAGRLPGALGLAGGRVVADPARRRRHRPVAVVRDAHGLAARRVVRGPRRRRDLRAPPRRRPPGAALDRRVRPDDHGGGLPARGRLRLVAPHARPPRRDRPRRVARRGVGHRRAVRLAPRPAPRRRARAGRCSRSASPSSSARSPASTRCCPTVGSERFERRRGSRTRG